MTFSHSLKSLSHHAYCIVGDHAVVGDIKDILEKEHGIDSRGNPDFFERRYQTLAIDDARELKSLHDTRPVGKTGRKIFIISLDRITSEAQNALLKLLEEPSSYTHFFLVVPSPHLLLPTVRSRVRFIGERGSVLDQEVLQEAEKFIKSSKKKRLEMVGQIVSDVSDDKRSRREAVEFLNAVELLSYKEGVKSNMEKLEKISFSKKYLNDRAPSLKMLLEYVALSI